MLEIGIIGGGPAGIAAALSAAKSGARVTIIEHMPRIGKKLLITGSGKCNISNEDMSCDHFHSSLSGWIEEIFKECPYDETLSFLCECGIYIKSRNGYLYPFCEQASSVVDSFRFALRDAGIIVQTEVIIKKIEAKKSITKAGKATNKFQVYTDKGNFTFDKLILAAGSKAYEKTGSDGSGYNLARNLGHKIIKPLPALTYLNCKESFYSAIAGIRTRGRVTLLIDDLDKEHNYELVETGEIQITKSGISGIPVFNLSHIAVKAMDADKKVKAIIDFLPDMNVDEVRKLIIERINKYPQRTLEELFTGVLHKNLAGVIIKRCFLKNSLKNESLSKKEITRITMMTKAFETEIVSSGTFDNAQVASGGIDLREVTGHMESKLVKNLYFAGEILDINGDCGGYNLHFAFTSGIIAGKNAARDINTYSMN